MSDWNPEAPLARADGESIKQHQALMDYYEMGLERSLDKLLQVYKDARAAGKDTPTVQRATLGKWSARHHWQARIEAEHDRQIEERKTRRQADVIRAEDEGIEDADRVIEKLRAALEALPQEDRLPEKLAAWLNARLKADRLRWRGLGEPDRITGDPAPEQKMEVILDLSHIPTEELAALLEGEPEDGGQA